MNNVWRTVLCAILLALPMTAQAQFGGGGYGYGYYSSSPPLKLDIDPSARQDFTPIVVLDAAGRRSLASSMAALDRTVENIDIAKMPLSSFASRIQQLAGIRVTLDVNELEEAGIETDTAITCRHHNATLRTIMNLTLQESGLGWSPTQDGLVITSAERQQYSERHHFHVVYPVADLISSPNGGDYDSLIELITCCLEPNSWKEGGVGEGTIAPYDSTGSIIVNNSWQVHEKINGMLASLRASKVQQGIRGLQRVSEPATSDDDERDPLPPPTSRRRSRTRWAPMDASAPVVGAKQGGYF